MKDNKQTAESFQENTSSVAKKTFNVAKKIAKKAKLGAKTFKLITTVISSIFGSVSFLAIVFIVMVAAILSFALASVFSSYYNDENAVFDDDSLANACSVQQSKTYKKMQKAWDKMISELDGEMETQIASLFDGDYSISSSEITKTGENDNSWIYTAEVNNTSEEGTIYRTIVSIPIQLQVDSPEQLMNTIAGYIEANYATIFSYNNMMEELQKSMSNKKTINILIGKEDNNGDQVTSEACEAHNGTVEGKVCKNYTYIPKVKKVSKTGTCTYQDGNWSTEDDETHTCSDEEWVRKKHITETSANSSPTDGSTYTYSYFETKENKEVTLEDFDLDDFDDVIDEYIENNSLMYYTIPVGWSKDLPTTAEKSEKKIEKVIACTRADEGCVFTTESSEIGSMTISKTIAIYTKRAELSKSVEIDIGTNVDSSDSKFLASEREKTIKNIELLAENSGETVSGEYEYNESVSTMADTLNFLCPDYNIDLSLITGSTYSSFGAIDSAVDTPGVFGNEAYWYDSSKGLYDVSQLSRNDVYQAIWSYDAYLIQSGKVTQSGWWPEGEETPKPQCVDFVNARFYAQYGLCPGGGNGRDIATTTVAKYPDKFTNGVDASGKLNLKAGSIISTTANANPIYGHVGFVEAVETDDSGKITSITISDANFTRLGAPGGVRLHCVYTWDQFVYAWGQNSTFAVPIN